MSTTRTIGFIGTGLMGRGMARSLIRKGHSVRIYNRTHGYGRPVQGESGHTDVYFSRDPFDFGIDHDEGHWVCTLPVAAPEIIKYEGQYYIAALLPSLKGIRIARLEWETAK